MQREDPHWEDPQWAVVVSSFDLDDSSSKVVGLPVEVGDTVQVLDKPSDKWWLCSDGEEMGYIPPSSLLVTSPTEDDTSDSSSVVFEWDLVSILKSVEESSSREEEKKRKRKVSFSSEHRVHVIPRDDTTTPSQSDTMTPSQSDTMTPSQSDTTTPSQSDTTPPRGRVNLLEYLAPILAANEIPVTRDPQQPNKLKIPTRKLLKKTYGYFSNPGYKSGYARHHAHRCEKDACHFWRDQNHDNCFQTGEFIAPQGEARSAGLVGEGVSFISGLFGDLKEEEEEEEGLKRSRFNLMSLLISD